MSAKVPATMHGDRKVYAVADFVGGVAGWIGRLPPVWVEGEIAEVRRSPRWSVAYLTLKDPAAATVLPACMSRERFDRIEPSPRAGDQVHAFGRPELFRARADFRFRVERLEPVGLGALLRRIEELRARLAGEGLFADARKRPLPLLPRVVGLICGSDAAARDDVVENASLRYPPARFRVVEAAVQGPAAVGEIVAALRRLDRDAEVDVIVLARGGGSVEDLLPFSDERLCRAIAACGTPVVSAVGHEGDTPLCDLVADVRAGTPSLAAKLVVPDHAATREALDAALRRGARALHARTRHARAGLAALAARPAFADPAGWIIARRSALALLRAELERQPALRVERETRRLGHAHDRLRLLGPAATLARGYAIVQRDGGAVVREAAAVERDERLGVLLAQGRLTVRVEGAEA